MAQLERVNSINGRKRGTFAIAAGLALFASILFVCLSPQSLGVSKAFAADGPEGSRLAAAAVDGQLGGSDTGYVSATAKSISGADCKLSSKRFTYNGQVRRPRPTVKLDGHTLKAGEHYTYSYSPGCKNTGTYKVIVKGIGKYKGTLTRQFVIQRCPLTSDAISYELSSSWFMYNGNVRHPRVTLTFNDEVTLKYRRDYVTSYPSSAKEVGEHKAIAHGRGNFIGDCVQYFYISPPKPIIMSAKALKEGSTGICGIEINWECSEKNRVDYYTVQFSRRFENEDYSFEDAFITKDFKAGSQIAKQRHYKKKLPSSWKGDLVDVEIIAVKKRGGVPYEAYSNRKTVRMKS